MESAPLFGRRLFKVILLAFLLKCCTVTQISELSNPMQVSCYNRVERLKRRRPNDSDRIRTPYTLHTQDLPRKRTTGRNISSSTKDMA